MSKPRNPVVSDEELLMIVAIRDQFPDEEQAALALALPLDRFRGYMALAKLRGFVPGQNYGRWTDEALLEVRHAYARLGTLEQVGRVYGLTRERIRQLLKRGLERGLFTLESEQTQPLTRETLDYLLATETSLVAAAAAIGRSQTDLSDAFRAAHLDYNTAFARNRKARALHRIDEEYRQACLEFGHHPSSHELQHLCNSRFRHLCARITNHYGGLIQYRRAKGIVGHGIQQNGRALMRRQDVLRVHDYAADPQRLEERKRQIRDQYMALTERLGKPPAIFDPHHEPEIRQMFNDIRHIWGGMTGFVEWLGIERPFWYRGIQTRRRKAERHRRH